MKRFTKVLTGIALILFGIGCALIVVGKNRIDTSIFKATPEYHGSFTESTLEDVERISISVPYGYVIMEQTDEETVQYGMKNVKEKQLHIKESAGEFSITAEPEEKAIYIGGKEMLYPELIEGTLTEDMPVYYIGVPEGYEGSIQVLLDAGQVKMNGIEANMLTALVSFGEIRLEQVEVLAASLECNVGRIVAEGDFESMFFGEVALGALELALEDAKENYEIQAECGMGNMVIGEEHHSGVSLKENESKINSKTLELQVKAGRMEVEFEK
ncbi:MAG: hypothetical protein IJY09_11735 [Lachnospiraceae bacterium]|nr:hypothetical protein [Lachnospiraceae bacterium]